MLEEPIDVHGEKRWIQQIPQVGSTCGDTTTGYFPLLLLSLDAARL